MDFVVLFNQLNGSGLASKACCNSIWNKAINFGFCDKFFILFFDFWHTSLIVQKTSADDLFFAESVTLGPAFGYGDRLGTSFFATKNGHDCWRHTLRHGVLADGSCCCYHLFHKQINWSKGADKKVEPIKLPITCDTGVSITKQLFNVCSGPGASRRHCDQHDNCANAHLCAGNFLPTRKTLDG